MLSDQAPRSHLPQELLDLLRELITKGMVKVRLALFEASHAHAVQINGKLHRQETGIPQGASISSILCRFVVSTFRQPGLIVKSIFYADLERQVFGELIARPENVRSQNQAHFKAHYVQLMVRLIDDFLFISTSKADAEIFLRTMLAGVEEYGCTIAPEKSVINFPTTHRTVKQLPRDADFPWCGFVLDQQLNVRIDFARQRDIRA